MQLGSDFNFILMVIFTDIGRSFGFGLLMLFYLLPFYKRYEHTNTITALWGRFSRNIFTKLRGTLAKQLGLNQHKQMGFVAAGEFRQNNALHLYTTD